MTLTPRLLANITSPQNQQIETLFSQQALRTASSRTYDSDSTAPRHRFHKGDKGIHDHPVPSHFMYAIYARSAASLKQLRFLPQPGPKTEDSSTNHDKVLALCPPTRPRPKYRVDAPNLDAVLELSAQNLEHIELRGCYLSPSRRDSHKSPLTFPKLHTLIHTTRSVAFVASYPRPVGPSEAPQLRHLELSVDLPVSALSPICVSAAHLVRPGTYSDFAGRAEAAKIERSGADYGIATCCSLPPLLLAPRLRFILLKRLWGVTALVKLLCLRDICDKTRFPKDHPLQTGFPKIIVEKLVVSELEKDLVPALWLLDSLVPYWPRGVISRCELVVHPIPECHTSLALGRNFANKVCGGDVEESLLSLVQTLLRSDEDTAQAKINQWKRRFDLDLFAGSLLQPRLRHPPSGATFRSLHVFKSVTLHLSCLQKEKKDDAGSFLAGLPDFKCPTTIQTQSPCCER
eukprot:Protomagalhaensia_wolfi_Nauph_80__307@NODE_1171_length_1681_cov_10_146772_g895_i0_p1_GENE_NODE_1171_length_1681_cov_10_146772_g895_i0NODE_1171_length_1681_cov_10_146772_g895_i0_p1_ORF_typecomplete_len460_score66_18_NODE_1171_length_1681_cov_10_146772_g895_i01941573